MTKTKTDPAVPVTLTATFTAADDEDGQAKGKVKALVSAYGTKYQISRWMRPTHHTIEAGAFKAFEGSKIPLYAQHSWDWRAGVPIGHATVTETDAGLEVDGELYIDDMDEARSIYRSLKAGSLNEWSIGYRVVVFRNDPEDENHAFIVEAELLEASSVLRGANPDTDTLKVAGGGDLRTIDLEGETFVLVPPDALAELTDDKTDVDSTADGDEQNSPDPDDETAGWAPPTEALASSWVREYHAETSASNSN